MQNNLDIVKKRLNLKELDVPEGKVINPLWGQSKGVINYGDSEEKYLEVKLNMSGERELHLMETLPLIMTPKESKDLEILSSYVSMLAEEDLSLMIEDKKLYDSIINSLEEGSLGIHRFYMEVLFSQERDRVYSMYSTEFLKVIVNTRMLDSEKEIKLIQCLGNESGRIFPTTHLIEPSRGFIMSIRMNDEGDLAKDNDFELKSVDYLEALQYLIRGLILKMSSKIEGIDYFRLQAPIYELLEAARGE